MVLLSKFLSLLISKFVSKLSRYVPASGSTMKGNTSSGRAFFSFLLKVSAVGVSGFAVWQVYKWFESQKSLNKKKQTEVLFFPDSAVACRSQFTQRHGCLSLSCRFSHDPQLSYARLMRALASARLRLDICVFCLTCKELTEIVTELNERGVIVRVITDSEQVHATGSQVGALRAAGIQVRHDSTSYFMHHKFIIIDGCMLVNGSFNWTRQAITGNFENVLITTDTGVLNLYKREFERLWSMFNPQRR